MDISKYNRLVEYVTQVGDPNNRNRAYRLFICYLDILWQQAKFLVLTINVHWTLCSIKTKLLSIKSKFNRNGSKKRWMSVIVNIAHLKAVIGTHKISLNQAMKKTFHHKNKK